MEILYIIIAMVFVGFFIGWLAGKIWKDDRKGDYTLAIIVAVATSMASYFVIPALGLNDTWLWVSLATEPAGMALIVLWLVRKARR